MKSDHETCDEDGLFNSCLYPKKHNSFLYSTAWLSLTSGMFAIYKKHYDLAIVPLGVWLSSILYWHNPVYHSWRRTIDVTVVRTALVYQLWRARSAEYKNPYYATVGIACCCYPLSSYFLSQKNYSLSVFSHSLVHIFGNVSNFILYQGFII